MSKAALRHRRNSAALSKPGLPKLGFPKLDLMKTPHRAGLLIMNPRGRKSCCLAWFGEGSKVIVG
jgi:hypothetical protein